jgi:fucose 4-O-acetylase-like acetyltransferase
MKTQITPRIVNLTEGINYSTERIEWIDIAKGIGIMLVVIGHLISRDSYLGQFIGSFHMPLFFLLSGMCFRPEKYPTFLPFLKKRVNQLLIPLLLFNLIIFLVDYLCFGFDKAFEPFSEYHFHGAQWFIFVLFLLELAFWGIQKLAAGNLTKCAILCCGVYILADWITITDFNLPFNISSVPSCLCFYSIGCLGAHFFRTTVQNGKLWNALIILLINAISVFFLGAHTGLSGGRIGFPSSYYIAMAIITSIGVFILSKQIAWPLIKSILVWIGRNTLVIVCLHMTLIGYSCHYIQPHISHVLLYKIIEACVVWFGSLLFVILVNRFAPVLAGKGSWVK